ncbi:MAG TPA: PEP-CTERM sorting domain-containing protein [Bryobacteraceae bacterium]|nr:PEP-CTERM sorting domain-containing protein [Bryobacteraceae bacterium]
MVLAVLLGCGLSNLADAGDITYSSLQFNSPIFGIAGSSNDVTISGTTGGESGTYTLSAEFCQTGFCIGDNAANATDQLRMTNLSLSCSGSGTCAPLDISFQASGSTDNSAVAFEMYLENASATGTTPSGYSQLCIADGTHFCTANASGSQSTTFNFAGSLIGTVDYFVSVNGPFTLVGDFHLDGLANGSTVTLGNSLEIADVLPEPSTILLVPVGLAALVLLRRIRRRTA